MTPTQRGGPVVSRQYRNCVSLSGPPPPVPESLPASPSSPAPSSCFRPPLASHHPCYFQPYVINLAIVPTLAWYHLNGYSKTTQVHRTQILAIQRYISYPLLIVLGLGVHPCLHYRNRYPIPIPLQSTRPSWVCSSELFFSWPFPELS